MSKTGETNSIMSRVMEKLESGKYDGEPDFNLMKILNEDQIETYIEIREMFEQVMELDNMKEAKIIAWNTYAYFGIIIAIFSVAALYWSIAPIS